MRLTVAAITLAAIVSTVAASEALAAPNVAGAREHFRKGSAAFKEGRHIEAAQEFEAAYRIVGDPILLFNIGQAYEKAGDVRRAIVNYEAYVDRARSAEDRGDVQVRIAGLRQAQAAQVAARPVDLGSSAEPSRRGPGLRIAGALIGGVGVAALVAGIVIGNQASSRASQLHEQSQLAGVPFSDVVGLQTQGRNLATTAYALYGVGSALALTGAVLLIVDFRQRRRSSETALQLSPSLSPTSAGVRARWAF